MKSRQVTPAAFVHVDVWIFDLDNTLYPPSCRLFDQIDRRMTSFIESALSVSTEEADALRVTYWNRHGTTLKGLMAEHGMAADAFLEHVHDIDLNHLTRDAALAKAIDALPGRKIVHTNGTKEYAARVLAARGLEGCFEAVYGIAESAYEPKPQRRAYDLIQALDGFAPNAAAMFEDTARNLLAPHEMGMRTVLAETDCPRASDGSDGAHVHFSTSDLTGFLGQVVASPAHGRAAGAP